MGTAPGSLPSAACIVSDVPTSASRPPRIRTVVEEKKTELCVSVVINAVSTIRRSRASIWRIHS